MILSGPGRGATKAQPITVNQQAFVAVDVEPLLSSPAAGPAVLLEFCFGDCVFMWEDEALEGDARFAEFNELLGRGR